ncbi:MAG TPA: hypothetical protein VMW69_08315 [Spirochaetia bacterium]|nr:hypothetical protein [Spirochaetia bacterium]
MVNKPLGMFLIAVWLGSLGSFVNAGGSSEPMSPVRVTGLPPATLQVQVLQAAWSAENLLRLTTSKSTGTNGAVEITGIERREFPQDPIAALRSDSVTRPSGVGRTILLFDNADQLLGEVALNQGAGARILETFSVSAGIPRDTATETKQELANVVLTRISGSLSGSSIAVPLGRSIVFNVGGVSWIFTCRGATDEKNLSFDYTLFRE